jgi:carboxypeptidase family protein
VRALFVVACCGLVGPQLAAQGVIKGHVMDTTGAPLRGAAVEVLGSPLSARTDSGGNYRLTGVSIGRQTVHIGHVARLVDVSATDTVTLADFLIRDVPAPRAVWLGCQPFGTCKAMRYVATFKRHEIPAGAGVIRDEATWKAFLARYATGDNAIIKRDIIDWPHEMLIVISYGGGPVPLDPRDGINRVVPHADRITVLLGPDSVPGSMVTGGQGWVPATVIAIPRSRRPVEYQGLSPNTPVPPTVTWSGQ